MNLSYVEQRGSVSFPEFTGERVYMREFTKKSGLPSDLSRWQKTVDHMLDDIITDNPIYIMIDQGVVKAGSSHRRAGLHLDGYWNPVSCSHGGGGHGGRVSASSWDTGGRWGSCNFDKPEALILASSLTAACGYHGEWSGSCGEGGDCSHIDTSGMQALELMQGIVYAGNVSMLHESLPVASDSLRTLVRLSVPGWSPELQ